MTEYVQTLAGMFDGFRIDNCHSTPLHVGQRLLDAARVVNPDLYVCAELFTGSEEMDITFVSRLGISSLIREAYNGWDPKELSRLLYRNGIQSPIGAFLPYFTWIWANAPQVPWMVHALPRVEKSLHPLAKARVDHAL